MNVSLAVNIFLLVVKIYAFVVSHSKAILASAADSLVDIASQLVIAYAEYKVITPLHMSRPNWIHLHTYIMLNQLSLKASEYLQYHAGLCSTGLQYTARRDYAHTKYCSCLLGQCLSARSVYGAFCFGY